MSKITVKSTFLILIFVMTAAFVVLPSTVLAQAANPDSGGRQSVQFDQPTATSGQSTSGYTDKNGKPLSNEEFLREREKMSKGIFERQPILSGAIVVMVIGAIYYFGFYRRKTVKK